jgi:hypothetical protein
VASSPTTVSRRHPFRRIHCVLQWAAGLPILTSALKLVDLGIVVSLWGASALLGLLGFAEAKGQELGPLQSLATWLNNYRFDLACALLSAQPILHFLRWSLRKVAGRSVDRKKIERVLSSLVYRLFRSQDRENHVYRATLFKARQFWLCGRWLGAFARSGHTYKALRAVFSIDSERRERNTGFAGECWRQEGITIFSNAPLPDVRADDAGTDNKEVYLRDGWICKEEYVAMNVRSRSFLATGIRVNGVLWGVLVIDTTDEKALPPQTATGADSVDRKRLRDTLEFAAEALDLLLQ